MTPTKDLPMTPKDGRAVALENEVRVLRALHRFGWLRTRDVAALIWQPWAETPTGEPKLAPLAPTPSGLRMAQRTLRRLRERRQVLSGKAPNGSTIYALATGGSHRLQALGVPASTGKDQLRRFSAAQFVHRSVANEVAIGGILAGFRASTEREIAQNKWLGGAQGIAGKKPDVLLQAGGRIYWCEVEHSRKNAKDYAHLLRWLRLARQDALRETGSALLGKGMRWGKVVFVCSPAFKAKLDRDLLAEGWSADAMRAFIQYETALYSAKDVVFV